ncbi:MAG: N-6 DNA methylase [Myxococcales bacterium]|nr:N-6 DNA methylase [Myxococcales bacterium]MCB9532611.1 N-6 DNA methylase [Myxococcales bacterium]
MSRRRHAAPPDLATAALEAALALTASPAEAVALLSALVDGPHPPEGSFGGERRTPQTPPEGSFGRPAGIAKSPPEGSFDGDPQPLENPPEGSFGRPAGTFQDPPEGSFGGDPQPLENPPEGSFDGERRRPPNPPEGSVRALAAFADEVALRGADWAERGLVAAVEQRGRASGAAFYTPPGVARMLVAEAMRDGPSAPTVLDPCCGAGDLLLAAAERLATGGVGAGRLMGRDVDELAVALARWRLLRRGLPADVAVADTLREPLPPADVIVGNPPFGNAIERETARSEALSAELAARFPEAATGAYDLACVFVERALREAPPGARVALVLPRAVLSAPYAARLRAWIDESHRLDALLVVEDADAFRAAAVFVVGVVVTVAARATRAGQERRSEVRVVTSGAVRYAARHGDAPGSWAPLVSPHRPLLDAIPSDWEPISARWEVTASAAADEAYRFASHVSESEIPGAWRLVTTGAIDPASCRWGVETQRYLGERYETPWLGRDAPSARRAALYDSPKVLVAGLSRVLEAWADLAGSAAGAVATLSCVARRSADAALLPRLAAWLNGDVARAEMLALHGAQALGGGSVQVTKGKVGGLRAPPALWAPDTDPAAARALAERAREVARAALPARGEKDVPTQALADQLVVAAASLGARPELAAAALDHLDDAANDTATARLLVAAVGPAPLRRYAEVARPGAACEAGAPPPTSGPRPPSRA